MPQLAPVECGDGSGCLRSNDLHGDRSIWAASPREFICAAEPADEGVRMRRSGLGVLFASLQYLCEGAAWDAHDTRRVAASLPGVADALLQIKELLERHFKLTPAFPFVGRRAVGGCPDQGHRERWLRWRP